MPTINQLPLVSGLTLGDNLVIYSPNNGDTRRVPLSQLLTFFQQTFASPTLATNIYTPSTGFSIPVPTPVAQQQWMLLSPAAPLASGTIVLPLNTITPDGTEVLITTTQPIAAFSLGLNGAASAPSVTPALSEQFMRIRYVQSMNIWYRIS